LGAHIRTLVFTSLSAIGADLGKVLVMGWNENWAAVAACQGKSDALFVKGAEQNRAKQVCGGCSVRAECLAEALDNRIEWGVWGGMTERERRALLRRRPNVATWRAILQPAAS
jgi:WhiB family redox-sensing transcriptional regulator